MRGGLTLLHLDKLLLLTTRCTYYRKVINYLLYPNERRNVELIKSLSRPINCKGLLNVPLVEYPTTLFIGSDAHTMKEKKMNVTSLWKEWKVATMVFWRRKRVQRSGKMTRQRETC
ncbi:hypothetical protein PHAVU_011G164301 [Phaseolus vulgaris]